MRLFPKPRIVIEGQNNSFVHTKKQKNELTKYGIVKVKGNNNKICVGEPNYLKYSEIHITGHNNTIILPPDCYGKVNIDIIASNTTIIVGKKTGFMGTDISLRESNSRIIIGEDCMFAKNTRLYCTDFHSIFHLSDKTPYNQGKEIIIGNHVWLGEGVTVTKNTHLTDNIIVGINSTITKDLTTSYAIYAGNPADLKKKDIDWDAEPYDNLAPQPEK